MSTRINYRGAIDDFEEFKKRATDKRVFKELGELARLILYRRVKSGYGVNKIPTSKDEKVDKAKLLQLSSPYIRYRERLKSRGFKFGDFGKPTSRLSNLTLTGQMLDSLKVSLSINGFVLEISGTRSDGESNDNIATWVQEQGRPFFALTDPEVKIIEKEYQKYLRILASNFNRKG